MLSLPARRAALTFVPTLVILLLGAILYRTAGHWRDTDRLVERTRQADAVVWRTLAALADAESGQRGYLLSGAPEYLAPYHEARREIAADTVQLRRLLRDLGAEQAPLDTLRRTIAGKFAELDQTVRMRGSGDAAGAMAVVRSGRGRELMEHGRAVAERIRERNQRRLAARRAELRRYDSALALTVLVGTLAAAATALAVNLLLARSATRVRSAAGEVEAKHRQLQAQAGELTNGAAELRAANARLSESEERYRTVADISDVVVWEWAEGRGAVHVSAAMERVLLHAPGGDVMSAGWWREHLHPADAQRVAESYSHALKERGAWAGEYRLRRGDGSWAQVFARARMTHGADGRTARAIGVITDVTAEREAEAALRRSEAHFRALIENSAELVAVVDGDGRILFASGPAERTIGCPPADLVGRSVFDLAAPSGRDAAAAAFARAIASPGENVEVEMPVIAADGGERVLDVVARDLSHEPAVGGVVLNARDVTERRRTERELRQTTDALRAVVEASPLPIVVLDGEHRVTAWNPSAERVLGWTAQEVIGRPMPLLTDETRAEMEALYARENAGEPLSEVQIRRRRRDGDWRDLLLFTAPLRTPAGEVTGTVAIFRDVTERIQTYAALRDAEAQLVQAQKMEAVGRLAGGIAHDFNNLLTVIGGNVQLLLADTPDGDPARADLEETERAVKRAAGLTRQLLAFSRRQVMQPRTVDVPALVGELRRLLARVIGEDVELRAEVPPGVWPVRADPGQLEQVLVNLAVNARDAMPAGGVLRITARNAAGPKELPAGLRTAVGPGEHVLLEVADSGVGMDAATLARVFEPFYTTKPEGKGTGLGLSTVYGIVSQSGGSVWLDSAPGRGTTAWVCLPRDTSPDDGHAPVPPPAAVHGGDGTVLLLEDEPDVRAMVARILRRAGMRVIEARSPEDALGLAAVHAGEIDLVLSDVVMPRVAGPALVEQLRKGFPELRVLYMSGYTDDALLRHGVLNPGVELIEKPFAPDELVRRVRGMMMAGNDDTPAALGSSNG
jgi:PAS domain S-box-containing protein